MKRIIIMCALAVISVSAFAQKKNVEKAERIMKHLDSPFDISNANLEIIQQLRELIEPALTHPESKDLADTWRYAGLLKMYDINQMIMKCDYRMIGKDFNQYLKDLSQNLYDHVQFYENYDRLMHTPDKKGKLPYKEQEMREGHMFAQTMANTSRSHLLSAARTLVYTDTAFTMKLLDLYFEALDNPLFKELDLRNKENENIQVAQEIYAQAQEKGQKNRKIPQKQIDQRNPQKEKIQQDNSNLRVYKGKLKWNGTEGDAEYHYRDAADGTRIWEGSFEWFYESTYQGVVYGTTIHGQLKNNRQVGKWYMEKKEGGKVLESYVTFDDEGHPSGQFELKFGSLYEGTIQSGIFVGDFFYDSDCSHSPSNYVRGSFNTKGLPEGEWQLHAKVEGTWYNWKYVFSGKDPDMFGRWYYEDYDNRTGDTNILRLNKEFGNRYSPKELQSRCRRAFEQIMIRDSKF